MTIPQINQSVWGETLIDHLALTNSPDGGINVVGPRPSNPPEGWFGYVGDEFSLLRYSNGQWHKVANDKAKRDLTFYVSPAGNNTNLGLSADKPLASIQLAIDKFEAFATGGVATIKIAPGTYAENIRLGLGPNYTISLQGTKADFTTAAAEDEVVLSMNSTLKYDAIISGSTGLLDLKALTFTCSDSLASWHCMQLYNCFLNVEDTNLWFKKTTPAFGSIILDYGGGYKTFKNTNLYVDGDWYGLLHSYFGSILFQDTDIFLRNTPKFDWIFGFSETNIFIIGSAPNVRLTFHNDVDPTTVKYQIHRMNPILLDWIIWPPSALAGLVTGSVVLS
jgi:hypothetical protein